jgi:radical SAM enzyme (TIGR01210 family)
MLLMVFEEYEIPPACWAGKEYFQGEVRECLTIILRSGGCSWGRCLMCGYTHVRYDNHDQEYLARKIRAQIAWVKKEFPLDRYSLIKIFTSGSFLDPAEMPKSAQQEIIRLFRGKVVILETRPEHVTVEWVSFLLELVDDGSWDTPLYLAMGLETTSDFIREKCIRKGSTRQDFVQGADRAHCAGAGVKMYLLMKPPFLTENEAVEDMITSVKDVNGWSDLISMNLCTVQTSTPVERLWRNGAYRPSYLWSVLTVLASVDTHILCDPVGGGTPRGPHNCGSCDREIVNGIRAYSLTGDKGLIRALLRLDCGCMSEWRYVLENEMPYGMPLTR